MHHSTLDTLQKGLLTALFLIFAVVLNAQQTSIKEYVIFGGNGNCQNSGKNYNENDGCLVLIGNRSNITGGAVGSYQLIKTTGAVTFAGNLFSGGTINLANTTTVGGNIAAANSSSSKKTILQTGPNAYLKGNIDVNGNISIGGGNSQVDGKVTHPKGTTYSGPNPKGGNITGTPSLPTLPQMPEITSFPLAGSKSIYESETFTAGAYDKIKLEGNKTITFSGSGEYIFNSINNIGVNTFIFDFKNNSSGTIKLYIYGDVDLDNIKVKIINGGDASRIYTEVHGNGSGCWDYRSSFNMGNSFGVSCKYESEWQGTVWAPNGAIRIGADAGNVTITGALLSGTKVDIGSNVIINFAPFSSCTPPDVYAGPDTTLNVLKTINLVGSSKTPNVQFSWQGLDGGEIISGANTSTAEISVAGTYVLTATTGPGCFATDTVIVTGKSDDILGPELKSLFFSDDRNSPLSQSIFLIQNDSVYVEVIAMEDQFNTVLSLLQSPEYGMTDFITNGQSQFIITGKMPIANLLKLNDLEGMVNFCRPLYPALTNAGVSQTAGDSAMRTNYVRNSFGVQGDDITIGVMSDSYNTLPGNPANNDVVNGDLPGSANPLNTNPVRVLKEFPLGQRSDEGRAMLQIVHDIAPKAKLSFRTGFLSPGDFAAGIRELAADGCNVIVDDITFITEPFFKKGAVDSAVTEVTNNGVVYITAAGNFGNKSYGAVFNPVTAPARLRGMAHNFGGGDILQSDSVKGSVSNPGVYTLVLQWVDDIYSLSGSGTSNDLDIYLADDAGNPIVGYNRNNIGGDPLEILPFTVTSNSTVNIMIINTAANPSPNLRFKYVVFRGDLKINEYNSESSTIVGHGKSTDAFTVGAARYSQTPAFGVNVPVKESFSSPGGNVLENGIISQKPDIVGPDGVNTTINFGNVDSESDGLPNFFGTSAAAPHVAGAAALLLQASKKFYNAFLTPASVKTTFQNTAVDMDAPGFDFNTGYGFIQADAALRTIANPNPQIISLEFTNPDLIPGAQPMEVLIHGNYFSPDTKIIFGNDTLLTLINSNSLATVTLPIFYSDKLISAYSPSITPSELDGGISNSISINGIPKKNITIVANNQTKKFGAVLPNFTSTILVDGDSLQNTSLTVADLGLTQIKYQTPATDLSDVGIYFIRPSRIFDSLNTADLDFLDRYNYTFTDGALTITKLPLTITSRDTTLIYGQKAGDFAFNYSFDAAANLRYPNALLNTVKTEHENQLANDVIGLVNGQAVVIVNGQAVQIVNGQAVQIVNGQAVVIVNGQAVQIVNGQAIQIVNGQAVVIVNNLTNNQVDNLGFLATTSSLQETRALKSSVLVNGVRVPQTTNVIDVTQESILNFNRNSAQTTLINSVNNAEPNGIVDVVSYTNGQAVQIVNGQAVQIVNGQAVQIVNGQAVQIINGQAVVIVNGDTIPIVNAVNRTAVILNSQDIGNGISEFKSLNMVTGLDVGEQFIIPAAFSSNNFDISYAPGKLTILPAPLTIKIADTMKMYGSELTLDPTRFSITSGDLMYGDSILTIATSSEGTVSTAPPGLYPIIPGVAVMKQGQRISNYDITYINGNLKVGKASLIVKAKDTSRLYGDPNPEFTYTFIGLLSGDTPENSGITGKPSFSTTATITSNVGNYPIIPSMGTLSSNKYSFSFEKGTLSITPAPLYVKADDKVIFQGGSLPKFTAKITNLKFGDNPKVSFKVDPKCTNTPGVYEIIPTLESFANAKNYMIYYTNGKLYVNPKCGNAKALKVKLNCVEKVANGQYIAHFYVVNDNSTPLYIPAGWNNFVSSLGKFDRITVPEIFAPGITKFDIPFDGNLIQWVVSSYEKCWFIPSLDIASFWSQNCGNNLITSTDQTSGDAMKRGMNKTIGKENNIEKAPVTKRDLLQNKVEGVLRVYPNPVQNNAVVYLSNENISEKGSTLYDVSGKVHPIKFVRQITPNSFEIDMSGLQKGYYLIKVKVSDGYKSIMIIKG